MRLIDLPKRSNICYTRPGWTDLAVTYVNGEWVYLKKGIIKNPVSGDSQIWKHSDFYESTSKGELKMKLTYNYDRPIFYENFEEMEEAYELGVRNRPNSANTGYPRIAKNSLGSTKAKFHPDYIRWPELKVRLIAEQYPNYIQGKDMKDVNYIGGPYDVVAVTYIDDVNRKYNFKIDKSLKVEKGDLVVVDASNGLGLANVAEIYENLPANAEHINKATAWVVDVVDTSAQNARKDATEKRTHIMTQLEEKKKSMEAIEMYALLAKHDPEAAKLIEELKALGQ